MPQEHANKQSFKRRRTYVAAGSAVVPPPRQRVKRLLTLHAHGHFIVPNPTRGPLPQLSFLQANTEGTAVKPPADGVDVRTEEQRNTNRNFLHLLQGVLKGFILLLEDLYGLLESLWKQIKC